MYTFVSKNNLSGCFLLMKMGSRAGLKVTMYRRVSLCLSCLPLLLKSRDYETAHVDAALVTKPRFMHAVLLTPEPSYCLFVCLTRFIYFMCMSVFCLHVLGMCTTYVPDVCGFQKRASDALELGLQTKGC